MSAGRLSQEEAQHLYGVSAFFLLQSLPCNTQISLDGYPHVYLTTAEFQGIKLLPPGWHCVSWNVAVSESASSANSHVALEIQKSVKNVVLRWFDQGEVAVRSLDRANEELIVPGSSTASSSRSVQRRHYPEKPDTPPTILSQDLLKTLDAHLLPYPYDCHASWQRAVRNLSLDSGRLGKAVVAKVVGLAADSADATLDSLTTAKSLDSAAAEDKPLETVQEGNTGRTESGKLIWGKSRPDGLERFEQISDGEEESQREAKTQKRKRSDDDESLLQGREMDDGALQFTAIDLRRSWPLGSSGPDITKWSRDKSWLLSHTMQRCYLEISDADRADMPLHCAILCELELAFILFLQSGNAHCWEQWKRIISVFCRSSSFLGAGTEWELHPAVASHPEKGNGGDLVPHTAFLQALHAQMALLQTDFWSTQTMPTDEKELLSDLDVLRANIGRALSHRAANTQPDQTLTSVDTAVQDLIGAWRGVSHLTMDKFNWNLDRRLDEESEVAQDLEAEEGDDAPVIIEM